MYEKLKILGIIGARGGSKGLPGKNIIDCAGKPLIQWTIEASKKSKYIDHTFVSTDCTDIAKVAKSCDVDLPFMRPANLSTDDASIEDVLQHTIASLEKMEYSFDYVILLQPTSPLRTCDHIDRAIEQYFKNQKDENDTMVSVYQAEAKAGWLLKETSNGYIDFCFDNNLKGKRRQDLDVLYYPNGAFYLFPADKPEKIYTDKTQFFIMKAEESIDIDYIEDLVTAEKILKNIEG